MFSLNQTSMADFQYLLDKFMINETDVNRAMDDSRTAMLTKVTTSKKQLYKYDRNASKLFCNFQLLNATKLISSANVSELISLPDLKTTDLINLGPWDIPFFKLPFRTAFLKLGKQLLHLFINCKDVMLCNRI